jgi:2-polyprenyl-3-methyl-5-hydroxy-6-metoxy-1,4-benzoquinol methylase
MTTHFSTCIICGNNSFKPVHRKLWKDSSFVQCKECRLIFQNPQEPKNQTIDRYGDNYFQYEVSNEHNFFHLVSLTLDAFSIYDLLTPKSRILEIGSATGLFLKHMDELGHESTGLEICPQSVAYGSRTYGVDLRQVTLEDAELPPESFDFIHFSHLIEHVNRPDLFLQIISTLLKPGGHALITTPNSAGLFAGFHRESWRCIVDDHLFLFSSKNLRKMLMQSGLKPVSCRTWGSIPLGAAPMPVKRFFDWFVKRTGYGDVVAWLAQKEL